MQKYFCILFLFCWLPFTTLSATDTYRFRSISPEGGFCYGGVQSVRQDRDGFIWILIEDDLYRFDGYQYKQYRTRFTALDSTKEWLFYNMIEDDSGQFFVRTNNGVYRYDKINDIFTAWNQDVIMQGNTERNEWLKQNAGWLPEVFKNKTIRAFCMDKNGNVWLGYRDGLYVVNPQTKAYTYYQHDMENPYSLPHNSVWTINKDLQGNMWIGMYAGKLAYVNLDEKFPFTTFTPQKNKLNLSPVSAFVEDKTSFWIGTEGGGINRMNKQTGQFTYYTPAYAHIKSMVVDKDQNLWIGMFNGGLDRYNPQTNQSQHFVHNEKDKNSLWLNNIRKIVLESDTGLWVAYQEDQLRISYFSFQTQKFTHFDFSDREDSYYVFDMVRGKDNQLWVLTGKTLYRMDVRTRSLTAVVPKEASINQNFMSYSTLCLDDSGNLWLGTIGNGLVKQNPETGDFTLYKDFLRLGMSSIYSICCDNQGNLWMGTNNGLLCYNIEGNTFFRYGEQDDIQGNIFYPLASIKGLDGRLYFGGTDGFTIVDPHKITYNPHQPRVMLSEFLIDNLPIQLGKKIDKEEIVLNYKQTNFGFQLASDNYLMPEKTLFKYRLKGYDKDWIEINASTRTALYTNVPPGNYTFEALAANNDGVWGLPAVVKIHVNPAPWFSWWAYVIYGLMLLGILYLIVHLYLETVEKNKNEELHEIQMCFYKDYFTNISEIATNERDKEFLESLTKIVKDNLRRPELDVNFIAAEMSMSHSTLYKKVKTLTGKSIIEYILHLRLRKAANLMLETDLKIRQIMNDVGIDSQSYFTSSFKKEFGETPSSFVSKHK